MPKVDLKATKDFTYMTRRLTAGDPFQARNPLEARILTRVRKVAEVPTAKVAAPKAAPAPVAEPPKAPAAPKAPSTAIKAGKPGGSKPGKRARKAAAKK